MILLRVVLTDLPSKCSQSNGAGLLGFRKIRGWGPLWDGRGEGTVGDGEVDEAEAGMAGVGGETADD